MFSLVASIFSARLVARVFGVLAGLLLARAYGAEQQGIVSYMLMLSALMMSFSELGTFNASVFFARRGQLSNDRILGISIAMILGASLLVNALFHGLAEFVFQDYFSQYPRAIRVLTGIIFPLEALAILYKNLMLAEDRIRSFNRTEILQASSVFILYAMVIACKGNILYILVAHLSARAILLLSGILSMRHLKPKLQPRDFSFVFRFSRYTWLSNLLSILNLRVDAIMLSWFIAQGRGVTATDLGLYTISIATVAKLTELQTAVQTAVFPKLSELDSAAGANLAARTCRFLMPAYLLISILFCLLAYPILWLYGPEYPAAYGALAILAVSTVLVRGTGGVLMIFYTGSGRPEITVKIHLLGLALNLVGNALLIPRFGIEGAAATTAISIVAAFVWLLLRFLREHNLPLSAVCTRKQDLRQVVCTFRDKLKKG